MGHEDLGRHDSDANHEISRRKGIRDTDMTGRRELISLRARTAIRDLMSGTTLRQIDDMWPDELFSPAADPPEAVGGQRVTRFQGYLDQVLWSDAGHVARAIRVFEVAIQDLFHPHGGWEWTGRDETIERIRQLFESDGYKLTDEGHIVGGPPYVVVAEKLLSGISDPAVIELPRDCPDLLARRRGGVLQLAETNSQG